MLDINKIPLLKGLIVAVSVITCICPGLLGLFFFHNNLFLKLDFLKLLTLSAALSIPFFLASFTFSLVLFNRKDSVTDGDDRHWIILTSTSLMAIIVWLILAGVSLIYYWIADDIKINYIQNIFVGGFLGFFGIFTPLIAFYERE